jgi:hypothetical protein
MFKAKRRRGYTGREAIEEEEKDRRRAIISSARDTKAARAKERA